MIEIIGGGLVIALLTGAAMALWNARRAVIVYAPDVALLYRDGLFVRELSAGRHVFFDVGARMRIIRVARTLAPVMFGEIGVLTKDQFAFRVGLTAELTIVDARAYQESIGIEPDGATQRYVHAAATHPALVSSITAAAIEAVSTLSLDEVVGATSALAETVQARVAAVIPGAEVSRVLVTALTLPPETRKMFTDVERARREALAAVERARGEHAALRVLANAARLVTDNPALANLRLLQTIEASKGATTIIMGDTAKAGVALT